MRCHSWHFPRHKSPMGFLRGPCLCRNHLVKLIQVAEHWEHLIPVLASFTQSHCNSSLSGGAARELLGNCSQCQSIGLILRSQLQVGELLGVQTLAVVLPSVDYLPKVGLSLACQRLFVSQTFRRCHIFIWKLSFPPLVSEEEDKATRLSGTCSCLIIQKYIFFFIKAISTSRA